jgi:hypothetical protein
MLLTDTEIYEEVSLHEKAAQLLTRLQLMQWKLAGVLWSRRPDSRHQFPPSPIPQLSSLTELQRRVQFPREQAFVE